MVAMVCLLLVLASLSAALFRQGRTLVGLSSRGQHRPGGSTRPPHKRRGFISIHPSYRSWLHEVRLVEPDDFLALDTVIVSGHPSRQVGRITLGEGTQRRTLYLKREYKVRWLTRLSNFLAGFGLVSGCVREASVLSALERDGIPAPRWLATGEDCQGQSFLLVEEVENAVGLATALEQRKSIAARRELASELGRLLACLHEAGFCHHDLYAKHVLVGPDNSMVLLDWQRAWRGAWIPQTARIRDLAALHATLVDHLAGPRERLALLTAYLRRSLSLTRSAAARRLLLRQLMLAIVDRAEQMWQRRHIREKRQPPTLEPQNWIALDGEALCVTPAMARANAGSDLDWLRMENQPTPRVPLSRRWLTVQGRLALLIRRTRRIGLVERFRSSLLGQPLLSAEQRCATLLWRLERHGIPVPHILAFGQRRCADRQDSFLLYQSHPNTIRLGLWLGKAKGPERRAVLRQLGEVMARIHEACCYFTEQGFTTLAVCVEGDKPRLVLENVEGVWPSRRPLPRQATHNLTRLRTLLEQQGCDLADWGEVLHGHAVLSPNRKSSPLAAKVSFRSTRSTAPEAFITESSRAKEPGPTAREGSDDSGIPPLWTRILYGWRRLRYRPDWVSFLGPGWPEQIMQTSVTDRFHSKQGRSTGRWRLVGGRGEPELVVYLKRHYSLGWWAGLMATLWPRGNWSPAMQEFAHLQWAREQGLAVPSTVAAGEFIGPWFSLQSFLAVEELTGMLPLNEAIPLASRHLPPAKFLRWKRGLIKEMARMARLLHDRRHYHKDFYLCHFFISAEDLHRLPEESGDGNGWRGRVFLIDLHRLSHHPWTWWQWQLKDLAQLLYSSEVEGIDARDQVAFWMHYRGPGARKTFSRWLRALVLVKWRTYRRHNLRKQLQSKRQECAEGESARPRDAGP